MNTKREIIFEQHRIGLTVKMIAIDVETQIEVSVIGPVSASGSYLEKLAHDKLLRMIDKKSRGE